MREQLHAYVEDGGGALLAICGYQDLGHERAAGRRGGGGLGIVDMTTERGGKAPATGSSTTSKLIRRWRSAPSRVTRTMRWDAGTHLGAAPSLRRAVAAFPRGMATTMLTAGRRAP